MDPLKQVQQLVLGGVNFPGETFERLLGVYPQLIFPANQLGDVERSFDLRRAKPNEPANRSALRGHPLDINLLHPMGLEKGLQWLNRVTTQMFMENEIEGQVFYQID